MKKLLFTFGLALFLIPFATSAQIMTVGGGTGSTSPSGILYGNGTLHLGTVNIGSNLTFSGGTLSASGSGGSSTFGTTSISAIFPLFWNTATAVMSWLGLSTTTPWTNGNIAEVSGGNLTSVPTTTVSCSGSVSCTSFTILGPLPITISGSGSGGSGLSTSSPIASSNLLVYSSTGAGSAFGVATSSAGAGTGLTFSGTSGAQVGGTSGTYSVNTTQNITTLSNLGTGTLNTNAGVLYNTGTSTPTVSGPITYSGTLGQFIAGASGAFGCTTAASGVAGCLNSTDWATFNNKISSTSISITTTGGSGASTYTPSTGVFNIPQYQAAGSGTSGNCVQWGASNTLGDAGAPCGSGGGATFGNAFNFVSGTPNYLIGTTSPLGLIMTASSTIGGGTQANGLTINGGATTTGNVLFNLGGIASSTFAVGANGYTNPAFQIFASSSLDVTGLQVRTNIAGGGVSLLTTSSGANEPLSISSKGSSGVSINTATGAGNVTIQGLTLTTTGLSLSTQNWGTTNTPVNLIAQFAAGSNLTAATNVPYFKVGLLTSLSAANSVVPYQTDNYFTSNVHAFTSFAATNNYTNLATVGIEGPPRVLATGNGTTTLAAGLIIGSSTPSVEFNASTTNTAALVVYPSGGATNNYDALFLGSGSVSISGNLGVGTTTPVDGVDIYNKSKINIIGDGSGSQLDITKYTANASGNSVIQNKSRGSQATPSTVVVGDTIGANTFEGYGSTGFDVSSSIVATVGSTASGDNISGILSFLTANSSGVDTTALTINDSQNVGIGTTSPFATLSIATTSANAVVVADGFNTPIFQLNTASTTGSIFTVVATTSPNLGAGAIKLFDVDQYGHMTASSTPKAPSISACGTGSPSLGQNANDDAGSFVTGTSASACTITFGQAYAATPVVVVSDSNTSAVVDISAVSTTAFTISLASALSAVTVYYIVVQP